MAYAKDSAVIVLYETEDGYVAKYYLWDNMSPPPVNTLALDNAVPEPDNRQDRISATKAELKTELEAFVDNFFAQ